MPLPDFPLDPHAPDERLERWLDGDLPAGDAERVARAVAQFPAWARAARASRDVQAMLRATTTPAAPPDFARGVMDAIARHEQARRVPFARRLSAWWGAVAPSQKWVWQPALALATLALALFVAWPRPQPPTAAQVAQAVDEVKWTLAFVSQTSAQTGQRVRDRVVVPHVVAPVRGALETSLHDSTRPQ